MNSDRGSAEPGMCQAPEPHALPPIGRHLQDEPPSTCAVRSRVELRFGAGDAAGATSPSATSPVQLERLPQIESARPVRFALRKDEVASLECSAEGRPRMPLGGRTAPLPGPESVEVTASGNR